MEIPILIKTKDLYNRIAPVYDFLTRILISEKLREKVWNMVEGKNILEIGIGTGESFPHYPENSRVTGIDFSSGMLDIAKRKAGRAGENINLQLMDIMDLKFEDNCFDAVVSIFVFCSVARPEAGLKELSRVCKQDGNIYFLEHVRSKTWPVGEFMDYINPLVSNFGENINRNTVKKIRKAGLNIEKIETYFFDIVKIIEADLKVN